MKLNSIAFAHAATAVTAAIYVICELLSIIAPDFVRGIAQSWIHSLNLAALQASSPPSLGLMVWGLVTISALTWVTTWVTIELYNRLAKSK